MTWHTTKEAAAYLRMTPSGVQRSITGHSTQAMSDHYSEVDMDEKRKALAGVARLIGGGR